MKVMSLISLNPTIIYWNGVRFCDICDTLDKECCQVSRKFADNRKTDTKILPRYARRNPSILVSHHITHSLHYPLLLSDSIDTPYRPEGQYHTNLCYSGLFLSLCLCYPLSRHLRSFVNKSKRVIIALCRLETENDLPWTFTGLDRWSVIDQIIQDKYSSRLYLIKPLSKAGTHRRCLTHPGHREGLI